LEDYGKGSISISNTKIDNEFYGEGVGSGDGEERELRSVYLYTSRYEMTIQQMW